MKKMKYALHSVAALAVAALATACSSEDELNPPGVKGPVTITVYQPDTRVYYEAGTGTGYWQAGDKIGVILEGNNVEGSGTFPAVEFTINGGAGTATATFTGSPVNENNIYPKYAMFPYNSGHQHYCQSSLFAGNVNELTYTLPSSYTYTKVDQDYSQASGNSFCMPMFGEISNYAVTFKNIGGVVCMKIDKMPAASGTVTVKDASKKLCGGFKLTSIDDNEIISTSESSSDNTVTFTYSGATADAPGVFYLPVAVGEYTLTVTVAGDGAEAKEVTTKTLNMTRSKLKKVNITLGSSSKDNSQVIGGHKFIDLGLPSGLLWAETNIGAETAADEGNYYAWGETTTKATYSLSEYSYYDKSSSSFKKYNSDDNKTTLEASDDAAYVNWGSFCHMPTSKDLEELLNSDNCTWTWGSKTKSDGSTTINGYVVTSKKNDNSIFLPASGFCDVNGLQYKGTLGGLRSSSLNTGQINSTCYLFFTSSSYILTYVGEDRDYGINIRPVANPQ